MKKLLSSAIERIRWAGKEIRGIQSYIKFRMNCNQTTSPREPTSMSSLVGIKGTCRFTQQPLRESVAITQNLDDFRVLIIIIKLSHVT